MANKIIIKNNLGKLNDEELEKKLREEAKKKMLWNFKKDRTIKKEGENKNGEESN